MRADDMPKHAPGACVLGSAGPQRGA